MYNYFDEFKMNVVGDGYKPQYNEYGKKILYADWAASGRLYHDIEIEIMDKYGPLYSNLHSEGNYIAKKTELAYKNSKDIIRKHFGADNNYAIIACGHGMTSAFSKLQSILLDYCEHSDDIVVFLTPYEHNSNFVSWKNKDVKCIILKILDNGQVDLEDMESKLKIYSKDNYLPIGVFNACSNVNGIKIDLKPISSLMKLYNGITCVDYTTIAPYDNLDMVNLKIDALVFSAHKLIGGVGGPGILILSKRLYKSKTPTQVGGGTVRWVNPWGDVLYKDDIEEREEAGTPPILPLIRAGLALELKEKIGIDKIIFRELSIAKKLLSGMKKIKHINIFDKDLENRLPIVSFSFDNITYLKGVSILDQKYGIQVRGGCCCASIYGHYLLNITPNESEDIFKNAAKNNDLINTKGWIRISLSPIVTDEEVNYICDSIHEIAVGGEGDNDKESKGCRRKLS